MKQAICHFIAAVQNLIVRLFRAPLFSLLIGFMLGVIGAPVTEWVTAKWFPPPVRVELKNTQPFMSQIKVPINGRKYLFYRIGIRLHNLSETKTAKGCQVYLSGIATENSPGVFEYPENFRPILLLFQKWLDGEANEVLLTKTGARDVLPGMQEFVVIARFIEPEFQNRFEATNLGKASPALKMLIPPGPEGDGVMLPRWIPSHLDPGKHRILIKIFFENRPPIFKEYELKLNGKWTDAESEMQRQVQIKEITKNEDFVLLKSN